MEQQAMETKKRPTFLTVLCILSYIGVAFQIISAIISIGAGAAASGLSSVGKELSQGTNELSNIEGMDQSLSNLNEATEALDKAAQYASVVGIVNIIAALICLVGVIMMWKLKKTGFYIYAVGELGAPIVAIILMGFSTIFGGMMLFVSLIVPILFTILYALNLKHME
jgi:ABC-type multidrug transport system fused ATPase/permease subunit